PSSGCTPSCSSSWRITCRRNCSRRRRASRRGSAETRFRKARTKRPATCGPSRSLLAVTVGGGEQVGREARLLMELQRQAAQRGGFLGAGRRPRAQPLEDLVERRDRQSGDRKGKARCAAAGGG